VLVKTLELHQELHCHSGYNPDATISDDLVEVIHAAWSNGDGMVFLVSCFASVLAAEPVDYLRDVKPILAKRCYACHGPFQQKSGLRLDTGEAIRGGGE